MEKSTLLLKVKIGYTKSKVSNETIRVAKIKTAKEEAIVEDAGKLQDIIVTFLNPVNSRQAVNIIMNQKGFNQLDELLDAGFVLKINETEKEFKVVITKDSCSVTFAVSKEQGIDVALDQANDWAEEMLIQLKGVKTTV